MWSKENWAGYAGWVITIHNSHQPMPNSIGHRRRPTRHIQLDKDVAQMTVSGAWANHQNIGHLAVRMTLRNQAQHLKLPPRQLFPVGTGFITSAFGTRLITSVLRLLLLPKLLDTLLQRVHHVNSTLHAVLTKQCSRTLTKLMHS